MKNWFKNLVSFSLILIYCISLSVSIQNFIINSLFNENQSHDVSVYHSNSKSPTSYLISDLESFENVVIESFINLQTSDYNKQFQIFKHIETYTISKDSQYFYRSKNIHPGLDIEKLLYPFHTFS
ncbi:hypothetical protein [Formosa maritima]|uniref:Uncharacterized protein n=1 Tax=Formosa maritima TaxID=2592046 RepID=A0A5D0GCE3_9FLAO|nr:hypothetical protein [Formosa maritima]TYA56340.1 hypothetical protein FVF61_06265 [Formosa maritima]